jgi:hypothetical protein
MRRSGDIGRATLDAARRALAALADRADAMTKKQAVRALWKEIGVAHDNGCGFDEIAAELTKSGIAIGTSTLKGYWSQPGPGSDPVETRAERRPRQSQSTRARSASSRIAEEASALAQQAAEGPSPSASRTAGVDGRDDRLAVDPLADVSTGEVREPAPVAEEPADGGAQDTFQLASVGEPTEIEPRADASPGELRRPGAVAEGPAKGRAGAAPPPASVGGSASRSPVDQQPAEAPPGERRWSAGGRPARSARRQDQPGRDFSPSADGSTGEVREPAVVAEAPAGGHVLATIQAASVGERMVEPPWDASPGKLREPAAVAERLATGRAAAGPPPAGIGESASRSPVDQPADAPPASGDGQPVVDQRGAHVVKINRGEI